VADDRHEQLKNEVLEVFRRHGANAAEIGVLALSLLRETTRALEEKSKEHLTLRMPPKPQQGS
jgi:hypothetical protein